MTLRLITGAPGWLGTRLVELLACGFPEIESLTRPDRDSPIRCLVQPGVDPAPLRRISPNIQIVVGDILDREALAQFFRGAQGATLYHAAGIIHPRRFIREIHRVNVDGTRLLLVLAHAAKIKRFIAVSSISPMGFSYRADEVFDETRDYHPYMNYGLSKMRMEKLVHEFHARGAFETVIARPTWFYGPGQSERQDTFFQMIRKGIAPVLGDGMNRRSMSYIDNLCQVMLLAENTPAADGQTYWAADERPYTVNEIVDTVEELLEKDFGMRVAHKRMRLPFIVSEAARAVDWAIQTAGLYQQKLHVLGEYNKTIACSVTKAQKELGYRATIDLREGMRRSIAWCLDNGRTL